MGVEDGQARIDWARRSMPISAKAAGQLQAEVASHIGIAVPLDPATASMALWLIEAGFKVSVLGVALAHDTAQGAAELLAILSDAGANICDSRDAFVNAGFDIALDDKGEDLPDGLSRAVVLLAHEATAPDIPIIHLGASSLLQECVSKHGQGQSCVSGFLDITNLQIAGSHVLVIGYDAAGQGIAKYASSYGARVIVCEQDPVKAVKATLDGHQVAVLDVALPKATVVFHALENETCLTLPQLELLPSGAFLCSAGHSQHHSLFDQIGFEVPGKIIRDHVTQHELGSGTNVKLVCNGMPIHSQLGKGFPLEIADVQIAAQLHALATLIAPECDLGPGLHPLPNSIEIELAKAMLEQA
ncbi:hypothetical protein [uncultured Erythrobacter sp.]|uniref:adenosylhomocysteinase n=1 Tax=uncultured Erythrobacter sp. TaxID=263913 RepID=UPI0026126225|nr:hypothetical protein [uncultured Erythrobacter sp.]